MVQTQVKATFNAVLKIITSFRQNALITQHAKKVLSDSPGIGLVNSVFNLPDGQVMFYEEFE